MGWAGGSPEGQGNRLDSALQDWNKTILFWFSCEFLACWGWVGGPGPENS